MPVLIRGRWPWLAASIALLLAVAATGVRRPPGAAASTAGRTVFALSFTTQRPQASTGYALSIRYQDPNDPEGKPQTFSKLVIELPAGTVFDTGVVPTCTASNAELLARGASACPPESQVGGGTVRLMTGFGPPADPFTSDVTVLQGPSQLIDLFTAQGSGRPLAVDRVMMSGSTLTDEPQSVPGGPPDGRSAVRTVKLAIAPRSQGSGGQGRSYVTTPAECPASGFWESRATVFYDDGVTDTAVSTIPCSPSATTQAAAAPMRLAVFPRTARARTHVRFRFQVRSSSPACRRGAIVAFAARRAKTNARGRATLDRRLRRPGTYRATVTKPGCQTARTSVVVRPGAARSARQRGHRPSRG